jgi:hypothetical protein
MKITVIATGFDKEIAELNPNPHTTAASAAPSRYAAPAATDVAPRGATPTRPDDLDVPTFIRKKAD